MKPLMKNLRSSSSFQLSNIRRALGSITCDKRTAFNVIGDAQKQEILFLSSASWPQPNATAAGTRTNSLLELFTTSPLFSPGAHFGCGAASAFPTIFDEDLKESNVQWHHIKLNRKNEMKKLLDTIQEGHGPIKAVVFDRFYSEEAYSQMTKEFLPCALRILDMQDVHALRIGRQSLVYAYDNRLKSSTVDGVQLSSQLMSDVMSFDPRDNRQEEYTITPSFEKTKKKSYDTFLRELASIQRSDLVLVCSSDEMKMLQSWNVPSWKMINAPFFCDNVNEAELPSFNDRCDFVTVGGFKHPPNIDSVKLLRHEIWPRIRNELNDVKFHVYGAYPTKEILSLHDNKSGFLIHGRIDDLESELKKRRVLLAPLRFGAGIKGKIVDAWKCGCPVISTSIGAEGMMDDMTPNDWGGVITSDSDEFAKAAVSMYTQNAMWGRSQRKGAALLNKLFNKQHHFKMIEDAVGNAIRDLKQRRASDLTGAMLWHQSNRSTEYFAKWIELKEKSMQKRK